MKAIADNMAELGTGLESIREEAAAAAASTGDESSADLGRFAEKMAAFHAAKSAEFGSLKASGPLPRHHCSPVGIPTFGMDRPGSPVAVQALDVDVRAALDHVSVFLGEKPNAKDPACLLRTMEEVAEMVGKAGGELHVSC